MKLLFAHLLILICSCLVLAQKMTDRELDRLAGKVKSVQVWNQKVKPDGTPAEEAETISETTYDEQGNIASEVSYGAGQRKTTYFLVKGERVSKWEWIGEDPTAKIKPPKGVVLIKKKEGPFDVKYKYKYKYDQNGRIVEISRQDVDERFRSSGKYVYDDAGRIVSFTDRSGLNLVNEIISSFKYDDKGNVSEVAHTSKLHVLRGNDISSGKPYVYEKEEWTMRYSDHTFDMNGNWTRRTATRLNSKGNIISLVIEVRYFTYL